MPEKNLKEFVALALRTTLLVISIFFVVLTIISLIKKNIEEKKAAQIVEQAMAEAEETYYEEMFPYMKASLISRDDAIITIPAYDEKFISLHPELKRYFVRVVSPKEIFLNKLNIDFNDGTWKITIDEQYKEKVKAQFSKDGKFVLVAGIEEGLSLINISRENELYGGQVIVEVEKTDEWYEKWLEEMKERHVFLPSSCEEKVKILYPNKINKAENFPDSFFDPKTGVAFEVLQKDMCILTISKGIAIVPGKSDNRYGLRLDEDRKEQIVDYFICPYSEFKKALNIFYEKTQHKKATLQCSH